MFVKIIVGPLILLDNLKNSSAAPGDYCNNLGDICIIRMSPRLTKINRGKYITQTDCRQARKMVSEPLEAKRKAFIRMNRELRMVTDLLTGQCWLNRHTTTLVMNHDIYNK